MFPKIAAQINLSPSFSYLATALGITTIAGIIVWRWWRHQNSYKSLYSLPSPSGHWLLKNTPQVLLALKEKKYFQLLFNWAEQLGPIYVFWTNAPILVLSKPKVIEETIVNGMRDGSLVRSQRARQAWNDISGPILLGQDSTE